MAKVCRILLIKRFSLPERYARDNPKSRRYIPDKSHTENRPSVNKSKIAAVAAVRTFYSCVVAQVRVCPPLAKLYVVNPGFWGVLKHVFNSCVASKNG